MVNEPQLFKIEKDFLNRQDTLLSVITFHDLELSPIFFVENEKLVDEYVYIDMTTHNRGDGQDIREYIVKLKEGYFLYFSRRPNDSRFNLKVFFGGDKKYSDIIFQINRYNNIKK